jgi:hypothetical protein
MAQALERTCNLSTASETVSNVVHYRIYTELGIEEDKIPLLFRKIYPPRKPLQILRREAGADLSAFFLMGEHKMAFVPHAKTYIIVRKFIRNLSDILTY